MARLRGRRAAMRHRNDFDAVTMGAAFARPGMDPRQWVSYGLVDDQETIDGAPIDPVTFDDEMGPLVNVTLHPSGVPARCRVGSFNTGNGEGEYTPFVPGDEVLVALPEGSEMADPVIISRLSNSRDLFPLESVAGQDPTGNKFSFRRIRTPRIEEYADSYMVRSAASGAFLLMSQEGNITIRDGASGAMQMTADVFAYQDVDGTSLIQLDRTNGRLTLMVRDAIMNLTASDNPDDPASGVNVNGSFTVGTQSNTAAEHVLTTEQLCNILNNLFIALGARLALTIPGALTGAALGPFLETLGTIDLPAALALAITPLPGTPPIGGGILPTPLATAIVSAIAGQLPKQTPAGPSGQLQPGVASQGFLTG